MDIRQIATYFESTFWLNEEYPTLNDALEFTGLTSPDLLAKKDALNNILTGARGLPKVPYFEEQSNPHTPVGKTRAFLPDPDFVVACNIILNLGDKRSQTAKLKDIKMSEAQFKALLNLKVNKDYWDKRVDKTFANTEQTAKIALVKNVENGDMQAIKYYNEVTGVYRPNQEIILNVSSIIARFMEVLARNVDQTVLDRVSEQFDNILSIEANSIKEIESA